MKQMIAKYLINKAIDDGRELPNWLKRMADADPTLAAYESAQRELISRLRSDSNAWAVATKPATAICSERTPTADRSTWTVAILATCACVLIGAMLYFGSRENPQVANQDPHDSVEPKDLEDLFNRRKELFGPVPNGPDSYSDILPVSSPDELGELTRNYVQEAGSVYGRGLALLDQGGR
jgi:hypothetical protein